MRLFEIPIPADTGQFAADLWTMVGGLALVFVTVLWMVGKRR